MVLKLLRPVKNSVFETGRFTMKFYQESGVLAASMLLLISAAAALRPTSASETGLYGFLLVLANFAGYIHTCNKGSKDGFRLKALSAQGLMISAGSVVVISSAFSSTLPVLSPRNLVIYSSIFVLFSIALIPERVFRDLTLS